MDEVEQAIEASFALIKEVQRRVEGSAASSIDPELRQQVKLARIALLKATKREVVLPPATGGGAAEDAGVLTSSSPNPSLSGTSRSDVRTAPAVLRSSFDPTSTNRDRTVFFGSGALWSVVLCCFYWNKRKLCEQALTTLQALLRCRPVDLEPYTTLFLSPFLAKGSSSSSAAAAGGAGSSAGAGGGPQRKAICHVGEGVFVVLSEYLATASEPAVHSRILHLLQSLVEGAGQPYFVGRCITRTLHAAFTVALQTSQDAVRRRCEHFLDSCVVRVTRNFVLDSARGSSATHHRSTSGGIGTAAGGEGGEALGGGPVGFATDTLLDDYTVDVEYDAPFLPIHVTEQGSEGAVAAGSSGGGSGGGAQGDQSGAGAGASAIWGGASSGSLDPSFAFQKSFVNRVVRDAVTVLDDNGRLPQRLKDLLVLTKNACKLATRPITGAPTEGNAEMRARLLALRMLVCIFHELPVANGEAEHRCAMWLSLVLSSCRHDLIRALVVNMSVATPSTFFEVAIRILQHMLRKCHFHLARELHTLLAVFVFPLASSRYCDFRQKHAVLAMVHELFSTPHLIVSFFVNYDCSPTFDAGGEYGGMLELLVDFVMGLMFSDIVTGDDEDEWLTSDQQQLLRGECVVALHALAKALYTWISEDPQLYALRIATESGRGGGSSRRRGSASGVPTGPSSEWAEVYLDNWESDNEDGRDGGAAATAAGGQPAVAHPRAESESIVSTEDGSLPRSVSFIFDPVTGSAVPHSGRNRNIRYHWKHIHHLLHNKHIAIDAVELVNAGKWKDAKSYLEGRRYIEERQPSEEERAAMKSKDVTAVAPGESSYAGIARFISEYPGISRDALTGIFDRVNKDPACKLLLRDYMSLLHYQGVPLDTALRDTTCKFMSWDRPMFEAQVWETIQACFGEVYAQQNPGVISAKDADTMAGVLLFLHSNLHNAVAKNSRFEVNQFVSDANACLDIPLEAEELRAMFTRVQRGKWELDEYGRTPAEAERASTVPTMSFKIMTERLIREQQNRASASERRRQQQLTLDDGADGNAAAEAAAAAVETDKKEGQATPATAALTKDGSGGSISDAPSAPPAAPRAAATNVTNTSTNTSKAAKTTAKKMAKRGSMPSSSASGSASPRTHLSTASTGDIVLLDPVRPSYCSTKDAIKLREEHLIAYTQAAGAYARKLEAVHRCFYGDPDGYRPQPYVVPHYGEHVRAILLFTYPSIMASVYMGFRVLEAAPLSRHLLDIIQILYDIAAAFVINLGDLHGAVRDTIHRCLQEEGSYQLTPPTRATFVPFLLNAI